MTGIAWLLAVGATWRVTLLIVADEITRGPRCWLLDRLNPDKHVAYLLTCPWCASTWVAIPVVGSGLAWSTGWGWQLATGALTASVVTGWLSSFASPDG